MRKIISLQIRTQYNEQNISSAPRLIEVIIINLKLVTANISIHIGNYFIISHYSSKDKFI